MSQIADEAGIGRATLYKYFSSIEEILQAWHDHQISRHLDLLADIRPRELTAFCLHALSAASTAPSTAATQRLVGLILDGLQQ